MRNRFAEIRSRMRFMKSDRRMNLDNTAVARSCE